MVNVVMGLSAKVVHVGKGLRPGSESLSHAFPKKKIQFVGQVFVTRQVFYGCADARKRIGGVIGCFE